MYSYEYQYFTELQAGYRYRHRVMGPKTIVLELSAYGMRGSALKQGRPTGALHRVQKCT